MSSTELLLLCAVIGAFILASALYRRNKALAAHLVHLEEDSLQQRRELWRMQRSHKPVAGGTPTAESSRSISHAVLARASLEIGSELSEPRVLETTVRATLRTLSANAVRIVVHDRRTDRFVRGPGAELRDGAVQISDAAPRAAEDLLLRATIRRRGHLSRTADDPASRALFESAGESVTAVAPLFDRALVAGLVVVEGELAANAVDALDVLATMCSLALANSRLRHASGGVVPSSSTQEQTNA